MKDEGFFTDRARDFWKNRVPRILKLFAYANTTIPYDLHHAPASILPYHWMKAADEGQIVTGWSSIIETWMLDLHGSARVPLTWRRTQAEWVIVKDLLYWGVYRSSHSVRHVTPRCNAMQRRSFGRGWFFRVRWVDGWLHGEVSKRYDHECRLPTWQVYTQYIHANLSFNICINCNCDRLEFFPMKRSNCENINDNSVKTTIINDLFYWYIARISPSELFNPLMVLHSIDSNSIA